MIVKTSIYTNLCSLDKKFSKAHGKDSLLYSKLAIMELCGWIEESMDDVVRRCAKNLRNPDNSKFVENEIIKRNFGFKYKYHFKNMLTRVIGLINFERIERKVDSKKRTKLEATLSTLYETRNQQAHTHIKGTTLTINAPSITKAQFSDVYDGLIEFDRVIKATRL